MSESPQQAIARIRDTVQSAENAGKVDPMRTSFADDLVIMAPGFPAVVGAKAAADFMAGFFAQFDVEISYASAEIVVMGDWAFDRGSFRQTLRPKNGGPAVSEQGNYLWLYGRETGDVWKHIRVTWNIIGPVAS
jgi:ketosteroid isomerase-like protein